jgi:hypothetical protein
MEVMEIDRAFMAMDTVLAPGGRMVHKIDLSDFAIFPNPPFHPLEFLTVNRPVHGAMTSYTGSPNRRFVDYYRHKMRELGYDFTIYIASMLGIAGELRPHKTRIQKGADFQQTELDLIAKIRRRLQPEFRKISDEDLLVTGILLVARKPGKTI